MQDIGYLGTIDPGNFKMSAYFEAHLEQGPVLEQQGLAVGIVPNTQGIRWFKVNVVGEDNHAGIVPMDNRKDSCTTTAHIAVGLEKMVQEFNRGLLSKLKGSVKSLKMPYFEFPSGVMHNAIRVVLETPTAMLLISCRGGIRHNETEYAEYGHREAGANILAGTIITQAKVAQTFQA